MAILRSQCDAWQAQGGVAAAKATHESIRTALSTIGSPIAGLDYDVFLQGSYRNDTNVRGDSDVDLVIQFNKTFYWVDDQLDPDARTALRASISPATYPLKDFDQKVQETLRSYYGQQRVVVKNKCITVAGSTGRLDADVVVASQHRQYRHFRSPGDYEFVEGIKFWGRQDGLEVINYPKEHWENGTGKNLSTDGHYKPSVRMFKNARTYLIDKGQIQADVGPSYFVECLLFNVPDDRFVADSSQTFLNVISWLHETSDWSQFVCQNRQYFLFGSSNVQWNQEQARALQGAFVTLWNNWGR